MYGMTAKQLEEKFNYDDIFVGTGPGTKATVAVAFGTGGIHTDLYEAQRWHSPINLLNDVPKREGMQS